MKSIYRTRKLIIIAIILSLLFHTSIILYILLQKTTTQLPQISQAPMPPELQQNKPKQEAWVKTKAGGGAPVFFKENAPEHHIDDDQQKQTTPLSPSDVQHHIDMAETDNITSVIQQEETKKTIIAQPKKIHQHSALTTHQTTSQSLKPTISTPPAKKLPTLAQLTQGFMNQVKEGKGQHLVSMLGSKKGRPSDEQIKYERYFQKLDACITNSFAINRKKFNSPYYMNNDIAILVVLNKNGTPKHITLKQSSGNKMLDDFITFILRDASSSFPPVPHYLPDDPLMVTFIYANKT